MNSEPDYVLCLSVSDAGNVHKDAIIDKCVYCSRKVWVMPHNIGKRKICAYCLISLPGKTKNDIEFIVSGRDLKEANRAINEKYFK